MVTLDGALSRSHTISVLAEVIHDGSTVDVLPIVGGNVIQQSGRFSSCDLQVGDREWVPRSNSDLLAPYGTEIRLWRGVLRPGVNVYEAVYTAVYAGTEATAELEPLGVFGVADVDIPDGGAMQVMGFDRGRRVSRNRWIDPYVIASGTNVGTAIRNLIADRYPQAEFNFAAASHTTPRIVLGEDTDNDPWQDAQRIAAASGLSLHLDGLGRFALEPTRDPDAAPIDAVYHEGEDATFVGASRRLTDEYVYNVVVAQGESSESVVVRAIAEDTNPQSATYADGPFGRVPYRMTSELITTVAQAQAAADSQLAKVLGATEVVTLDCVPDPRRRPGQVVSVVRGRTGVDARYVLDEVSTPLSFDGSQRLTTRRRRL